MTEEIDEFQPIRESTPLEIEIFKRVVLLEKENLKLEKPQIQEDIINIVRDIIK
jgi:hypothetical protein